MGGTDVAGTAKTKITPPTTTPPGIPVKRARPPAVKKAKSG